MIDENKISAMPFAPLWNCTKDMHQYGEDWSEMNLTIKFLHKQLAESERSLAQCHTENKNVHAENVKLWKVAMAAKNMKGPKSMGLMRSLSDLGDLI